MDQALQLHQLLKALFSMEHGQQEVQPSIPPGRTWSKLPEDKSQRDRLQRPYGNHQRLESHQEVQTLGAEGKKDEGESVTTTKNDPPQLVLWQSQPETSLGPIGHTISFMANWPPLVLYGLLVIALFPCPFMAPIIIDCLRSYPAIIGLPGQLPPHRPPGLYLCFWA
ncbi:hypothetical protein O181_021984 [Austropuccinia psidii MF-1]|uniref:Uncharacterized protein n=1 Tax=Austropuccinia psidii MF-1 TaxID=1389203 RepID=A0A9Q3CDY7_9BASI|nr:hypothetical protein [Austropuccinia psidii MF-1]